MELSLIDWLPEPHVVVERARAAAVADMLMSADEDLRQFKWHAPWKDATGLAERHISGLFHSYLIQVGKSIAIKVGAPQQSMAAVALDRFQMNPSVPISPLALRCLRDPDLRPQEMSFLAWSEDGQPWQGLVFHMEGTSSFDVGRLHLDVMCLGAKAYYVYAKSYHEVAIDPTPLKALFNNGPLDADLALGINPEVDFASLRGELAATGYPMA